MLVITGGYGSPGGATLIVTGGYGEAAAPAVTGLCRRRRRQVPWSWPLWVGPVWRRKRTGNRATGQVGGPLVCEPGRVRPSEAGTGRVRPPAVASTLATRGQESELARVRPPRCPDERAK